MSPEADLLLGVLGAGLSTELRLVDVLKRRFSLGHADAVLRCKNALVELLLAGRAEQVPGMSIYRLTELAAGKDAANPGAALRRRLIKRPGRDIERKS